MLPEIVATNLEEIYRDTMEAQQQEESAQSQQPADDIIRVEETRQIEDMQIDQSKRQRESVSPGVVAQEQKRKKDMQQEKMTGKQVYEKEERQTRPLQVPSRPSEPEPPGAVGGMVTEYVREREREKQKDEKRERSLTRKYQPKVTTRDLGIVVYVRRSSQYNIEKKDKESRDILREAMIKGKAKVQWKNPNVKYEFIHTALLKNTLNMNEIRYERIPDREYDMLRDRALQI